MEISKNKVITLLGSVAIFLMIMNSSTIYSYYFEGISNICLILGACITALMALINK